MSRVEFAVAAGISVETVELINSGGAVVQLEEDIEAASVASTIWGWSSLPSPTGWEESIRPKFTRQDVRQIARLEGEGELVGSMFPDLKHLQWTRCFVGMIAERNQSRDPADAEAAGSPGWAANPCGRPRACSPVRCTGPCHGLGHEIGHRVE